MKPPQKLILAGPTGNGKTTMAQHIVDWARRVSVAAVEMGHWNTNPPRVTFHRWQKLCDEMEHDKSFSDSIDPLTDEQLIVIDDIGAESDRYRSGKSLDALSYFLSVTQGRNWVLLTANYGPAEWATKFDARIEDRLLRDGIVADMSQVPSWSKL